MPWKGCKMTLHTESTLFGIMIVLSAFFAMSETALLSISKYKARHWFEKKKFGSTYVKKLKDNPEILLSTILIGNNLNYYGKLQKINIQTKSLYTSLPY